jgi:hypothetical protein
MPRYFFDVATGPVMVRDVEGVELGSPEAACSAATAALPALPESGGAQGSSRIFVVVRDEDGRAIRATSFMR